MNAASFSYRHQPPTKRQQSGVALAIALILLVVMTMLGLSSVKTITQQEKMAANSFDRSLAYQFAEAALREGEGQARIQALGGNAAAGFPRDQYVSDNACSAASLNRCANGLCSAPDPDCSPRWLNPNFNSWIQFNGLPQIANANGNVLSVVPEYFIELLRPVSNVACTTPIASASFDMDCNQKYPDPDIIFPCVPAPAGAGEQVCSYYRYRITARVQAPGRAAVMMQSTYSVQPQ